MIGNGCGNGLMKGVIRDTCDLEDLIRATWLAWHVTHSAILASFRVNGEYWRGK